MVRDAGSLDKIVDSGVFDIAEKRFVVDVAIGIEIGVADAVRLDVAVVGGVVTHW